MRSQRKLRGLYRRLIVFALAFLFLSAFVPVWAAPGSSPGKNQGELPMPSLAPSKTRNSILNAAESFIGTPYIYGGTSSKGLDCSGLVFMVFKEATGQSVPRTVATLGQWVLIIPRKELVAGDLVFFDLEAASYGKGADSVISSSAIAAADHVGIYTGEGQFLHSASAGIRRGVTRDSLSEASWARRFLFAGRVVSASPLSGMALETGALGILNAQALVGGGAPELELRGAGLNVAVSFPLFSNFSVGLRGRAEYDELLGTFRLPLELVIGQNLGFSLFAGPALTLGEPELATADSSPARSYAAPLAWIGTAGLRWAAPMIRSGASGLGLFFELRFNRYLPQAGQPQDLAADRNATISLGVGLRYRWIRY
ncbi:MAG: C40 family peptidase [Spirochaetia bacterium]|nr:C40 family peptidase [Spirochaetales bacterium]MDX9783641.1 C40 family peptidase [Spirochaetia bacterium]